MSKPQTDPSAEHDAKVDSFEQPLVNHLIELRQRLLRSILAVFIVFFPLYFYANEIYVFVAKPLMERLPAGSTMIATEVASPFLTPFKLAMCAAIFGAVPYILHQAWAFLAPGLYLREKRFALPLLASSIVLFYIGVAFAYFVVFPLIFQFMASVTPIGVTMMTDINRYLDFVLKLFFAFGFAFEVPIATLLMVWSGLTSVESLSRKRPYIIVGCFVVGMLLTPPDVISQVLLAVPTWILFELGIVFGRVVERRRPVA
ncbi:MAG: twin-arginine translocase subunit TatC [Gammaproteobacteria bacterium]